MFQLASSYPKSDPHEGYLFLNATIMKLSCILVLCAALSGCVTFNTNMNRQEIPEISRILVVSKLPNIRQDYLDGYVRSFPKQYQVCIVDAGPLALQHPDTLINRQLRECQSDVMLTLSLNRNYTSGTGDTIGSVNEVLLEMAPTSTRTPFWKSLATGGGVSINPVTVIARLRADGVIDGTIR